MANTESGRAELERCVEPDYVGLSVELPPFAGVSLHRGKGNMKAAGEYEPFSIRDSPAHTYGGKLIGFEK
jgi:hypothetical protein